MSQEDISKLWVALYPNLLTRMVKYGFLSRKRSEYASTTRKQLTYMLSSTVFPCHEVTISAMRIIKYLLRTRTGGLQRLRSTENRGNLRELRSASQMAFPPFNEKWIK